MNIRVIFGLVVILLFAIMWTQYLPFGPSEQSPKSNQIAVVAAKVEAIEDTDSAAPVDSALEMEPVPLEQKTPPITEQSEPEKAVEQTETEQTATDPAPIALATALETPAPEDVDASQQIHALIEQMTELDGAMLIRDGIAYPMAATKVHLLRKWQVQKAEVDDALDFIEKVATSSSVTAEPYVLQLKDGEVIAAEQWLREAFDRLQ